MTLFLFDDARAQGWEPFVFTRPVGELLFGCALLRERAERWWGRPCAGHVSGPTLAGFEEEGAPPVSGRAPDSSSTRILVSGRAVLTASAPPALDSPATLMTDEGVAGWILPSGQPTPPETALRLPESWSEAPPPVAVQGFLLGAPWELVERNGAAVLQDATGLGLRTASANEVPRLGEHAVLLGPQATIEPGVVVDAREGPVVVDRDARVLGPARVVGPLYVGPESVLLGGSIANSSIGRRCIVRGEVADSVITGFCNKAHDGYLGHALLGRWVNLGALTTNSDLKNTYGTVRVELGAGPVETGRLKVGCFLGDYVRTGIGTLLNTGAIVGPGSNLFSGQMLPKYVPPFSWGSGTDLNEHRLDRFLDTARRMQERRGQVLTQSMAEMLSATWSATAGLRKARGIEP